MNDIRNFFRVLFKKDMSRREVFRAWKKFYESTERVLPGSCFHMRDELPIMHYDRHREKRADFDIVLDIRKGQFIYYLGDDVAAVSKPMSNTDICGMLVAKNLAYFSTTVDALMEAIEDGNNEEAIGL